MIYVSIGGMQLKRWTGYFRIILPTMRVLKAAKRAEGCVHADTFKAGSVFYAVSAWDSQERMQGFARAGLHGQLTDMAMDQMAMFFNHSQAFESLPDRKACVAAWEAAIAARGGQGTLGEYRG